MAGGGPKISIGIDDELEAQARDVIALLKQARADLRSLEKEADSAIRKTGKVGDDTLKKIDDAKKRVGGLNAQLRGTRSLRGNSGDDDGGDGISNLSDVKHLLERGSGFKSLRGGIKRALGSTSIGQQASAFLNRPDVVNGIRTVGAAGAIALAGYSLARGALATYDKDVEGQRLGDQVALGNLTGQETGASSLELQRRQLLNNGVGKFGHGVFDALPVVGGILNSGLSGLEELAAHFSGVSESDIAKAKFAETTKELSGQQRDLLYERAKQDADGNAITTAVRDALNRIMPEFLAKITGGSRETKISEEAQKKLELSKALEAQGYRLISENNFAAADLAFDQSAKQGGNSKALNAANEWISREQSMKSKSEYARLMNPVPAYRMGM